MLKAKGTQGSGEEALGKQRVLDMGFEMALGQMEEFWIAKSPFINGFNEITVADLLAVCELEQPVIAGYDHLFFFTNLFKLCHLSGTTIVRSIRRLSNI